MKAYAFPCLGCNLSCCVRPLPARHGNSVSVESTSSLFWLETLKLFINRGACLLTPAHVCRGLLRSTFEGLPWRQHPIAA